MTAFEIAELIGFYIGAFGIGYAGSHQLLVFKKVMDKAS